MRKKKEEYGILQEYLEQINQIIKEHIKAGKNGTDLIVSDVRRYLRDKEISKDIIEKYEPILRKQIEAIKMENKSNTIYNNGNIEIEIRHLIASGLDEEQVCEIIGRGYPKMQLRELKERYREVKTELRSFCEEFWRLYGTEIVKNNGGTKTYIRLLNKHFARNPNDEIIFNTGACLLPYCEPDENGNAARTENGRQIIINYCRQYLWKTQSRSKRFRNVMAAYGNTSNTIHSAPVTNQRTENLPYEERGTRDDDRYKDKEGNDVVERCKDGVVTYEIGK